MFAANKHFVDSGRRGAVVVANYTAGGGERRRGYGRVGAARRRRPPSYGGCARSPRAARRKVAPGVGIWSGRPAPAGASFTRDALVGGCSPGGAVHHPAAPPYVSLRRASLLVCCRVPWRFVNACQLRAAGARCFTCARVAMTDEAGDAGRRGGARASQCRFHRRSFAFRIALSSGARSQVASSRCQ